LSKFLLLGEASNGPTVISACRLAQRYDRCWHKLAVQWVPLWSFEWPLSGVEQTRGCCRLLGS